MQSQHNTELTNEFSDGAERPNVAGGIAVEILGIDLRARKTGNEPLERLWILFLDTQRCWLDSVRTTVHDIIALAQSYGLIDN